MRLDLTAANQFPWPSIQNHMSMHYTAALILEGSNGSLEPLRGDGAQVHDGGTPSGPGQSPVPSPLGAPQGQCIYHMRQSSFSEGMSLWSHHTEGMQGRARGGWHIPPGWVIPLWRAGPDGPFTGAQRAKVPRMRGRLREAITRKGRCGQPGAGHPPWAGQSP